MGDSKFDSNPEALAWARSKVEKTVEKYRRFEREADTPERRSQWRKFANLLEMELIGGRGCVITPFDHRLPSLIRKGE